MFKSNSFHFKLSLVRRNGFTIVELVVVVFLIGVLTATAMARFLDSNTFNASVVRNQIISMARVGQQSALGRADVELTITPNLAGTILTLDVSDTGGTINELELSLDGVSTFAGDVNTTASCDSTPGSTNITNANPMTISFGELADLDASGFGAGTAVTSAVRICLNDTAADSVCISPSGYAYGGDCDV